MKSELKKSNYQSGGNIQTLGDIQFDSNKARRYSLADTLRQRFRREKYQTGGDINPLDPNSYGKKYVAPKTSNSKYSLTTTDSKGSNKTAPGAKEQYFGVKKPTLKSGDILTDLIYWNAELLDNPITRPILQNQMYKYMKGSEANPSVKTSEPLKGEYSGADPKEDTNYDLVAQYVYGNQNMPKAKYAPKSDYLEFLPTYSIKKPGKNYGNVLEAVKGNFWMDKMQAEGPDSENFVSLKEAKQLVEEKIKKKEPIYTTGENQMTEDNYAFGYDLGSYKIGVQYDEEGRPYVGVSDAWDFEPSTYKDKWSSAIDSQGVKRTYQQAYLAHKFGKPFKIYDRFYFDPETGQHIPDPDSNGKYQTGGDLISQLGYRNDSPFKAAPQLTINSPSISMENVSIPLLGISNQTGETKLMKPNKKYKFKNTSSVTEIPTYRKGGKINCETGGALDSILGAVQGAGAFLGPAGAIASGVATLVPLVKDLFSANDKTVVSASPGKYADGGEIHINPKNKGKFTAAAKRAGHGVQEHARAVLADPNATPLQKKRANFARNAAKWNHQTGGSLIDTSLFLAPQANTVVAPHPLQELQIPAATSPIVPGMPKIPPTQSNMSTYLLSLDHAGFEGSGKSKSKDRFLEKQMGGDLSLSSGAFQVRGNPNVVDGNSYPTLNANLDHEEVVSTTQDGNKFVFSTDLKDPQTGKAFSELAAKQEKAKGKAEKILKTHPYDEQAKSTISMSNANLNHISNVQEAIATALGHRNADGSTRQQYQTGGSLPYTGFNTGDFQKWYNQYRQGVIVPTAALKEDAVWGPKTSAAYTQYGQYYSDPNSPNAQQARDIYRTNMPFMTIPETTQRIQNTQVSPLSTTISPAGIAPALPTSSTITQEQLRSTEPIKYETPWTLGDTFKGIELLSKGIGAFGRAEKEHPLLDNTQITQEVYDPTANLAQTRRTYSNYLNAIGAAAPINLRRGLASSALSNRYAQDNQTLAQFNALNQGARSQYQQRVGAQRQFNVQSQFNTNNINAANRAAKDAVQQNFFTSIGQFGEDLNRKRYASDIINLYRNQAPDVFESYIKDLMK